MKNRSAGRWLAYDVFRCELPFPIGVANAIDLDNQSAFTMDKLEQISILLDEVVQFINDFTGEGAGEVLLIGITGQQYETGTRLSAAAREGATCALKAVLAELDRLGADYSCRAAPSGLPAWWEPAEDPSSVPI